MGLFDFARDVGRKIFDTDAEAADNIEEMIQMKSTPVKNLDVQYDDGVVTLCGECHSKADREQIILMTGNVKGVEKVIADDLTAPAPPPPKPDAPAPVEEKVEIYEIKKGDSLSLIAKHYYGDPMKYPRIYEANRRWAASPPIFAASGAVQCSPLQPPPRPHLTMATSDLLFSSV